MQGSTLAGYSALVQFTPRHRPADTLYGHLTFALKYEGISFIKNYIDMPDRKVDLLIRFLHQNAGSFSKRAISKEFAALSAEERQAIESRYQAIFGQVTF